MKNQRKAFIATLNSWPDNGPAAKRKLLLQLCDDFKEFCQDSLNDDEASTHLAPLTYLEGAFDCFLNLITDEMIDEGEEYKNESIEQFYVRNIK